MQIDKAYFQPYNETIKKPNYGNQTLGRKKTNDQIHTQENPIPTNASADNHSAKPGISTEC